MPEDNWEWDEWMAMSDAEYDLELYKAERQYTEWYASLTVPQQFWYRRNLALRSCLSARKLLATTDLIPDIFRDHLRSAQKRLLALRVLRATGIEPGHG
jgi:hypothetical protein